MNIRLHEPFPWQSSLICPDQFRAHLSPGHEYRGEGSPSGEGSPPSPGDIHMWPGGTGEQGHSYCCQVRGEKENGGEVEHQLEGEGER